MSLTIRYAAGAWWGVVAGEDVVLLPEAVEDADLIEVRRVLLGGGGVAQVIQALAGGWSRGLAELPPFGIALVRGGEAHTAVRGPVALVIEGKEPVRVDGRRASTWSEHVAASVTRVELSVDTVSTTPAPRWLPVRDAVVPVSVIRMQVDVESPAGPPSDRGPVSEEDRDDGGRAGIEEEPPEVEQRGHGPGPVGAAEDLPSQSLTLVHQEDEGDCSPAGASEDEASAPQGELVPELAPDQSFINMDHVWDATSLRSVEDAAVRMHEADLHDAAPPQPGGLVSGVPAFTTASDASGAVEGDHDGHTVVSAKDLATLRAGQGHRSDESRASGATASTGPVVLSARCPQGHDNPPHAAICATCEERLAEAPRQAPRPSLGTVQLPDGTILTLDRSVVFGRRPQATRVLKDDLPQLVTLNGSSISRTHVEVRLEDWNVLAVDLGSSNGTYLNRPGQEQVRLTAHDPLPLRSGDVLDLGDDVHLTLDGVP